VFRRRIVGRLPVVVLLVGLISLLAAVAVAAIANTVGAQQAVSTNEYTPVPQEARLGAVFVSSSSSISGCLQPVPVYDDGNVVSIQLPSQGLDLANPDIQQTDGILCLMNTGNLPIDSLSGQLGWSLSDENGCSSVEEANETDFGFNTKNNCEPGGEIQKILEVVVIANTVNDVGTDCQAASAPVDGILTQSGQQPVPLDILVQGQTLDPGEICALNVWLQVRPNSPDIPALATYAGSSDPYEALKATASTDNLELTITFN
jgi:hypothetical protein